MSVETLSLGETVAALIACGGGVADVDIGHVEISVSLKMVGQPCTTLAERRELIVITLRIICLTMVIWISPWILVFKGCAIAMKEYKRRSNHLVVTNMHFAHAGVVVYILS